MRDSSFDIWAEMGKLYNRWINFLTENASTPIVEKFSLAGVTEFLFWTSILSLATLAYFRFLGFRKIISEIIEAPKTWIIKIIKKLGYWSILVVLLILLFIPSLGFKFAYIIGNIPFWVPIAFFITLYFSFKKFREKVLKIIVDEGLKPFADKSENSIKKLSVAFFEGSLHVAKHKSEANLQAEEVKFNLREKFKTSGYSYTEQTLDFDESHSDFSSPITDDSKIGNEDHGSNFEDDNNQIPLPNILYGTQNKDSDTYVIDEYKIDNIHNHETTSEVTRNPIDIAVEDALKVSENSSVLDAIAAFNSGKEEYGLEQLRNIAFSTPQPGKWALWKLIGMMAYEKHTQRALNAYQTFVGSSGQFDIWDEIYLARLYLRIGNTEKAKKIFNTTLELLSSNETLSKNQLRNKAVLHGEIADIQQLNGNFQDALQNCQYVKTLFEQLAQAEPSNISRQIDLAVSYGKLGEIYELQGKLEVAMQSYQKTHEINDFLSKRAPESTEVQIHSAILYSKIGQIYEWQGKLDDALQKYQDAFRIRKSSSDKDLSNTQWQESLTASYDDIGQIYEKKGELDEAQEKYQKAHEIIKPLSDKDPSNTQRQKSLAISYSKIGQICEQKGELDEAQEKYQKAYEIIESLSDKDPSNAQWKRSLAVSYDKLGCVYKAQEEFLKAIENYNEALRIFENLHKQASEHKQHIVDMAEMNYFIGETLHLEGEKKKEALEYVQKAHDHIAPFAKNMEVHDWKKVFEKIEKLLKKLKGN